MILTRTPLRLSLAGGGTDLAAYYRRHGGFLITTAINKYMYVSINEPALIDKIRVSYSKVEMVNIDQIDSIKHDIVREALKYLKIRRPLEISSMADVSAGTGLGSSSAYAVGLLNGLNTLIHRHISAKELAEEACKIEIDLIGKPIGKQDQYVAAFGGILILEIDPEGNVTANPLLIDQEAFLEIEHNLMMFYTYRERDAHTILEEQSRNIPHSDILPSMHKIKEIAYKIKGALLAGDVEQFGAFLHEHWMEKRKLASKITDPLIDRWYTTAMENGAIGGRIVGAGGGGFFILCCKNGKRKRLRAAMEGEGLRYMPFRFDFEGSKVLGNF